METLSAPVSGPVVRPPAVAFRLASDARLARLAAAGSEGAMAAIFERHHQALHRYCHSLLGNGHDAADALQNTMIKALRALPGETREIALKPWLYRIAHNESISLLRARRPDADLDAAAHVSDTAASGLIESRERLRSLAADLGELTDRQRGALLMRELGGLEFTEVAGALQTSAAAVKQSVYEARCALQAMDEGRAMDCETVRRTLSDGDRRMLRGMRMRGHLRACAGCRDFQTALHHRPTQLNAMITPLPLTAAAAILHGILGGGSTGTGTGLATGLAGTAKAATGFSLAGKAATVVAVSATLAGGAVYAVPELQTDSANHATPPTGLGVPAAAPVRTSSAQDVALQARPARGGTQTRARRDRAVAGVSARSAQNAFATSAAPIGHNPIGSPAGTPTRTPAATPIGTIVGKPTRTRGRKPTATPGARPTAAPGASPTNSPGAQPINTPGSQPTNLPVPATSRVATTTPAGSAPAVSSAGQVPPPPMADPDATR